MGDAERLEAHGPAERRMHRPGRFNALSDGIFAIAMTLLALEIAVPTSIQDGESYLDAMGGFLGSLGVFVVAFLITAQYWLGHHRVMSYVHTVDGRALEKAVMSLLGIAALPAATRLIVGEAHWQEIVTATAILALTSLATVRFYAHVLRPEFSDIEARDRRRILASVLFNVAVYVVTLAVVAIQVALGGQPAFAFVLWFLLPLNRAVVRRVVR